MITAGRNSFKTRPTLLLVLAVLTGIRLIYLANECHGVPIIDPVHSDLRYVGLFLAAHKYFDVDRRKGNPLGWKYDPRVYSKHFPIPRLKRLHSQVNEACHQGALACIQEIAATAQRSYSISGIEKSLAAVLPKTAKPFYPLESDLDLFRYRVR
ncbi:wall-associated receptor kinase 5 [Plakobranchus ocellatus]|uniref:Wall-associated receptor kinase 5 n=1 Tax=Plakobranchus ocellatus TaxID=259542 RepID=A0AAV4AC53_9GAST|nr:wall-associated receptor kinase 5 [Plakobranchus ocellatus]